MFVSLEFLDWKSLFDYDDCEKQTRVYEKNMVYEKNCVAGRTEIYLSDI